MLTQESDLMGRIRLTTKRETLTEVRIRKAARAATGKRYDIWDSIVPGMSLRVTDNGRKSFTVMGRLRGKSLRVTLGPFPGLGLANARQKARDAIEAMLNGQDPRRQRNALLVKDACEDYLAAGSQRWSPEHAANMRSAFRLYLEPVIGDVPLGDVTRRDLIALLDDVAQKHPTTANRLKGYLSGLFGWALDREKILANPCARLKPPAEEKSRDRVYTDPELRAIWGACETALGWPYGPYVRFLLATAQRRAQVRDMRWTELDAERGIWTSKTKEGRLHPLPLNEFALAILASAPRRGPFVFSVLGDKGANNMSYLADKLRGAPGVPADFRLHDLRRTAATRMAELGVKPPVIDAILDHVAGGVTGVYQRYGYVEEMRHALGQWSARLRDILAAG